MIRLTRCPKCGNHLSRGHCIGCGSKDSQGRNDLPSTPVEVFTDMYRYAFGTANGEARTAYSSGKFDLGAIEVLHAVIGEELIVKRQNGDQDAWGTLLVFNAF